MVLSFESVDETQKGESAIKMKATFRAVLSCGTVYYAIHGGTTCIF